MMLSFAALPPALRATSLIEGGSIQMAFAAKAPSVRGLSAARTGGVHSRNKENILRFDFEKRNV